MLAELDELRSLRHADPEAFRLDERIGAVLVGPGGMILARRIERPPRVVAGFGGTSLAPWLDVLPGDHPRRGEDRRLSSLSITRDAFEHGHMPWL